MAKTFKGRVIIAGNITGEAAVTRHGFNTLATYYAGMASRSPICHDQGNPDLYQKEIADVKARYQKYRKMAED